MQNNSTISLSATKNFFFIGVAGTGMSALAQYCAGIGKNVSGSDRYFTPELLPTHETALQLKKANIQCFAQDGSGITEATECVVVSTAVEEQNIEYQKAISLGIPILKRSELLTLISQSKRTIAVAGTSGKSTTTAMLFDILERAGLGPSIISGAGLVRLQEKGLIGNAFVGKGDVLVIEADESDGSLIYYRPYLGIVLNIDKDHKELDELAELFKTFQKNCEKMIVNAHHSLAASFSTNTSNNFTTSDETAGYTASNYQQDGLRMSFTINGVPFLVNTFGKHNMENAVAAVAGAALMGVDLMTCSAALQQYKGIYRRNQVLGQKRGCWIIDDYAHNPAKVAAAIKGVQPMCQRVIAWFQPHGYGPTRFLRNDFVEEISQSLRPNDQIWMSEIFYAGGTAVKDISANDLILDLQKRGVQAFFCEHRNDMQERMKETLQEGDVLLLMGARDPSLEAFSKWLYDHL